LQIRTLAHLEVEIYITKYIISVIPEKKQVRSTQNMTIEKVDTWIYGQLQLSMTWQRFDHCTSIFMSIHASGVSKGKRK
jgi:hypothetical protein